MPGIVGIIAKDLPARHGRMVGLMVKTMMHEPFYTSGTMADERLGVSLGWACHQGASFDRLPIWNDQRNICLIFCGEEFSDQPAPERSRTKGGESVRDNGTYLVREYEEKGFDFLDRLNGWFSGVLVDFRERKVIVFNDRYGVGRIYYHEDERGFYFASEAKALLKVLPAVRQLDFASLGEFFSVGCVMQNRTFFSGVSLVPGGSAWTFSPGQSSRREFYFKKERWEQQAPLSAADYYEKLTETWAHILPRYFRGPERVALSLTGGVDSRMILACAPRPPGMLPCYTFSGSYRDCADVTVSRIVAKICEQPYRTIPLDHEFLAQFPAMAEKAVYVTDGNLDVSGSADIYANRIARQIAPVRVTGLNGGEILRSLVMFKPWAPCPELLAPEFAREVAKASATYASEKDCHRLSFIAFKQSAWHLYARLASERSQITIRSPYFDNDLVALAFQAPAEMQTSEPALRIIAEGHAGLAEIGTDRASRLRAIPGITQLRHMIQEFTFKAEYAYDYGMPQWVAQVDHLFAPLHLEKLFLGRHKFHHFRVWYRDHFNHYLKEMLLDDRSRNRPYLEGAFMEQMVNSHIKGNRNYTLEIHRVLTIEILQRQLIEANQTDEDLSSDEKIVVNAAPAGRVAA